MADKARSGSDRTEDVWIYPDTGMGNIGYMGSVNWYGLMVTAGILMGTAVADKLRRKQGLNQSSWEVLPWIIIPGVIGARLYHVVDLWWYYQDNLRLIPAVWTGGLGIFGGIGGGIVGLWWWIHKTYKSNKTYIFLKWLDVVAVGAPLGQTIGRWGNYFNQELYGKATSLPWGIYIKAEDNYFHPLFAYESLWNLLVFGVLWWVSGRKRWVGGSVFALYLGLYGLGRFGLEWLRIESWPVNKIVSLSLVVLSWVYIWTRHRRNLSFS